MLNIKKKSLWENEVRGVNGCVCVCVCVCVSMCAGKFISFFPSPFSFSPLHSYRPSNCHFTLRFAVLYACLPKPGCRGRYSSHCPLLPSLGPQMTSTQIILTLRILLWGLPSGSVVKNPPVNVGDRGWIPGPGRFHMLWGYRTCAPEPGNCRHWSPCALGPMLRNKRSHRTKSSPHLLQLEKAWVQQQRPSRTKNK